jgi:hypothetical protein
MSYIGRIPTRQMIAPIPTEGVVDDLWSGFKSAVKGTSVGTAISKAEGAVKAGQAILEDPYLPEVTSLVMRLKAAESKHGGSAGTGTKGVGLGTIVTPLRAFVTVKEHPLVGIAMIAGVFAIPFIAGYFIGKSR